MTGFLRGESYIELHSRPLPLELVRGLMVAAVAANRSSNSAPRFPFGLLTPVG